MPWFPAPILPNLYMPHDQSKIMAISDRVVIMKECVICLDVLAAEIHEQPGSRFVANITSAGRFHQRHLPRSGWSSYHGGERGRTISVPALVKMQYVQKDGPYCLAVRQESIRLSAEEGQISGRISRATCYSARVEYEIVLGD